MKKEQKTIEDSPIDIAVRDIIWSVSENMFGSIVAEDGERINRCKEFSTEVVQRARTRGLKAQVYNVPVINSLFRRVSPEFSFGHYFAVIEDLLVDGTITQFFQQDDSIVATEYDGDVVKISAIQSNFPLPQALKRDLLVRLTDANLHAYLDIFTDHRSPTITREMGIANEL